MKATKLRVKTCKWCGRSFVVPRLREYNAVKYCCEAHRNYAYLENHNKAQKKYMQRYGGLINAQSRLGASYLGSHPVDDFKKEYELIKKQLRRKKLR